MTATEQITTDQIATGDQIAIGRTDEAGFFTVKSIRDGMVSGIGLRTTEGEYVKLPRGYIVNRKKRTTTYIVTMIVRKLNVRETFTIEAPREGLARTRAISQYLRSDRVHPNFSGSLVEYEVQEVSS